MEYEWIVIFRFKIRPIDSLFIAAIQFPYFFLLILYISLEQIYTTLIAEPYFIFNSITPVKVCVCECL